MKGFILISTLLISLATFAGPVHIGNGGNAIKIAEEFYLLDLAEQGVAQEPFFKASTNRYFYNYFRMRMTTYPNRVPEPTLDLFAEKLAEIAELDPVYAEALITAFENVRWMFVNYRLNDIPVESIIAGPYYQVAARTNDVILIDTQYWQQMNEANHVALLIHELNYILIFPKREPGEAVGEKSTLKSRLQTGYLFTPHLQYIDPPEFSKRIQFWFPSRYETQFKTQAFYPFLFQFKNGLSRLAFNPQVMINGNIEGPYIAKMTEVAFKFSLCEDSSFKFKTADIYGLTVVQDVFDGDNNSQDVTSYVNTKIPDFTFERLAGETCRNAVDRLYKEINQIIPGVFYQPR